ncbi:MAG: HNH endonuclease [Thermodesulfobacteriota bacterium]|jgi:5-methylcytosine-specific restriction endonuclease McrA|nr:MAG: HNH endonuclease [Thermodesulfobacteriota bacterium]
MIDANVLVLNRSFFPLHITSVRRAFCLLYLGIAQVVDEQFKTFDFESWSKLAVVEREEAIGLVDRMVRIPRVILLLTYNRMPIGHVRFTRLNIYTRDKSTCQYCGKKFPKSDLSLDHVVPRSSGGRSTWENIVCCCATCNRKKGGRTPHEAGMNLLNRPKKPNWTPFYKISLRNLKRKEWLPFLNLVDLSYWHTELLE